MRYRWLSLFALLAGSACVFAQQPGAQFQPPAPQQQWIDPANSKLDAVLMGWEKAMSNMNTLTAEVKRTAIDKVFMSTEEYVGVAKYIKPNKASLRLQNSKKPQDFEMLVCNGQTAYKWEPSKKEIHIHQLPKPQQGQINDDNFVSMLFGMKASEAKRRYDVQLLPDPQKQNPPYYHYLLIQARDPQDKAEFTKARLVLTVATNLPRQIWFEQPNGNETTWDFPKMAPDAPVDPRDFNQPSPTNWPGWQLKQVALPTGQPRVIRPQDGK